MHKEEVSIAEAKTHFSKLINKVVYGCEEIVITKRGKPVAIISAPSKKKKGLASVSGWLKKDDPFFRELDTIIEKQHNLILRVAKGHKV